MSRTACLLAGALAVLCGCGTIVPGPRYHVDVDACAFSHDGAGVLYLEERYRLYPLLLGVHERHALFLYDCARRRHRQLAETGAFSASPHAPLVLHAPEWRRRFAGRGAVPDFRLLDYARGETRGVRMPPGFDDGYLSYAIPRAEWDREGGVTAFVHFYYDPGARPRSWKRLDSARPGWRRELWKVRVDTRGEGDIVARAEPLPPGELPPFSWNNARRSRLVSPDGSRELAFTRYTGLFNFNSMLAVVPRGGGAPDYVVRDHGLIGFVQAGKYILLSIAAAPVFSVKHLLGDAPEGQAVPAGEGTR